MKIPSMSDFFSEKIRKKMWDVVITPLAEKEREKIRKELSGKGLKNPNPEYDEAGLRFDIHYLNSIGGVVCMLPLEFMAEYADLICVNMVDTEMEILEQDTIEHIRDFPEGFESMNATAIGNMAYFIIHTKNESAKTMALDYLKRYLNWYLDKLTAQMTKGLGKLPIQ